MLRSLTILLATLAIVTATMYSCSREEKQDKNASVVGPKVKFAELNSFRDISGDIVFVTKGIYGGEMQYNCILKGKVRNISWRPYRDVYVVWMMYDNEKKLFPVYRSDKYQPSIFLDKIDYLDSKAEADFSITLDFYEGIGMESASRIREAVKDGREEAGIYVLSKDFKN